MSEPRMQGLADSIREATRLSYWKHYKMAEEGSAPANDPPHYLGLYVIINDVLERAVGDLCAIIAGERCRSFRLDPQVREDLGI